MRSPLSLALPVAIFLVALSQVVDASPLSVTLGSCSRRSSTSTLAFTEGYAQLVPNTENERGPTWESGSQLLRIGLFGTSSGVSRSPPQSQSTAASEREGRIHPELTRVPD